MVLTDKAWPKLSHAMGSKTTLMKDLIVANETLFFWLKHLDKHNVKDRRIAVMMMILIPVVSWVVVRRCNESKTQSHSAVAEVNSRERTIETCLEQKRSYIDLFPVYEMRYNP